jgi:hypothetical protein
MSVSTLVPGRIEGMTTSAPQGRQLPAALAAAMLGFFVVALDA